MVMCVCVDIAPVVQSEARFVMPSECETLPLVCIPRESSWYVPCVI